MSARLDQARSAQLRRVIDLARLLAHEALTLEEMAARMHVSTRTARRDLYLLQSIGLDVIYGDVRLSDPEGQTPAFGENRRTGCPGNPLRLDVRSWHVLMWSPSTL